MAAITDETEEIHVLSSLPTGNNTIESKIFLIFNKVILSSNVPFPPTVKSTITFKHFTCKNKLDYAIEYIFALLGDHMIMHEMCSDSQPLED